MVGKRVGCWGTLAIRMRRVGMWSSDMGNLLIVSSPLEGGYSARRRFAMVLLPEPEEPTRAVDVPGIRVRFRDERIGIVGREG